MLLIYKSWNYAILQSYCISGPGGLYDNINEYVEMFHYAATTILDNANKSSDGHLSNYQHVTGKFIIENKLTGLTSKQTGQEQLK